MSDGIRADFISANFMLAIVILVFVGFFCIRMLSKPNDYRVKLGFL